MDEYGPESKWPGRMLLAVMVLVLASLGYAGVRAAIRASAMRKMKICQENLTKIDGAKEQWALEKNLKPDAVPTLEDLVGPGKYLKETPRCPGGFDYTINAVSQAPVCPSGLPGHEFSDMCILITEVEQ